jgi:hypothetical protein
LNESSDYLQAAREGAIGPDHIRAEIGEVLIGAKPGRTRSDEITLFKSLGLAVEDVAAAAFIYQQAQKASPVMVSSKQKENAAGSIFLSSSVPDARIFLSPEWAAALICSAACQSIWNCNVADKRLIWPTSVSPN